MPGRALTKAELERRLEYATKLGFLDDADHWQSELDKLKEKES